MTVKIQFILLGLACWLQVSACLASDELDLANYPQGQAKADFNYLNRWLSKTVNNDDPQENLRQAIDKLHRIGGQHLGLQKAILIMKQLAEMNECNDDTIQLFKVVAGATGAVAGVIRRVDTVLRHFAQRAAGICEVYLDHKLVEQSKGVQVNLEALKPSTGRVGNLASSLAKHDGRFNPDEKVLANLIEQLAAGDERNVYLEKKANGDYLYYYGNLEYTYGEYLSEPCKVYTNWLANTVDLMKPVLLFASNQRSSGEAFFARRSPDFQLALFRYQACEDIIKKTVDLGDIFDALVY